MKFIPLHPETAAERDVWHTVSGEDGPMVTLTPAPHLLLSYTQWHSVRSHWPADMPVGVILGNDQDVEDLAADLPRLGLVALNFPKWVDGRDVLVDMMPLLHRTGFDAVALRPDQKQSSAERALGFFPAHYQGDVQDNRPLFAKADTPGAAA
jgi:uncharacterized protein (DUF934 family)